jgi:RNA polymerase sigma-70 factor (ECF subfamily)
MSEELEHVVAGPRITDGAAEVVAAYDANERDLFSFALAVTRDRGAAEDIVQEAFLRLVREAHAGRFPDNARAWLYRVTVNLARSRARGARVAERWHSFFAPREEPKSPEDEVLRRERDERVRRAVAALPTTERMAFLLVNDGMSGREVAEIIGRTEGATRTLLYRARQQLRGQLEAEVRA